MNLESEQRCSLEELKALNKPGREVASPLSPQDIQPILEQLRIISQQLEALTVYPTSEQMAQLIQTVESLRKPAGNVKEKFFSLPKPRLPKMRFSPWILLIPILLAVFLATCWSLVTLWRNLSQMFP